MSVLYTDRLELLPITLPMVEAVLDGRRDDAEALAGVRFPAAWPGRALVERAFACPLARLRDDPASYLWGGRLLVARASPSGDRARVVVGSVVLDGKPDASGTVEIGYGIEAGSQGKGYATEGTRAVVDWALAQADVERVTAATLAWHAASRRVIEKIGMREAGTRPHDLFGDLLVYEKTYKCA
jgi:[ribosomal protein S5]-alanine N-acetyltransferase